MNHPKRICVFAGSALGNNKNFVKSAEKLGLWLAKNNIELIYGASDTGLMSEIAKSTLQHGGHVIGIIPSFLQKLEGSLPNLSELIVTNSIHQRREKMFELADAFIAFPGGIGTLEELTEILSWQKLGIHKKPLIFLNIDGFWESFLNTLAQMHAAGFLNKIFLDSLLVVSTVDELKLD